MGATKKGVGLAAGITKKEGSTLVKKHQKTCLVLFVSNHPVFLPVNHWGKNRHPLCVELSQDPAVTGHRQVASRLEGFGFCSMDWVGSSSFACSNGHHLRLLHIFTSKKSQIASRIFWWKKICSFPVLGQSQLTVVSCFRSWNQPVHGHLWVVAMLALWRLWHEQVNQTMRHERVRRYAENRLRESLLWRRCFHLKAENKI